MGQAKRRGTKEQRILAAEERENQERKERLKKSVPLEGRASRTKIRSILSAALGGLIVT